MISMRNQSTHSTLLTSRFLIAVLFRARTESNPADAGLAWLKADGAPQIVRTYYLDLNDSQKIAVRARAMRERLGVLSGFALGLDEETGPARPTQRRCSRPPTTSTTSEPIRRCPSQR